MAVEDELRLAWEAYQQALQTWAEGAAQSPLWPIWDDEHRRKIFDAERRLRLAQEDAQDWGEYTTIDEAFEDALEGLEEETPRCTEPSGS